MSPTNVANKPCKESDFKLMTNNKPATFLRGRLILTASLFLLISACGWQLRGAQHATKPESTADTHSGGVRLALNHRNQALTTVIKRVAWDNNYSFDNDANTLLLIENEKIEKRPLTVTETGVAAQYQLVLTITFSQKKSNGEFLIKPQRISSWRSYDFDAKLIVAKSQEEKALIIEMREELAQRIIALVK